MEREKRWDEVFDNESDKALLQGPREMVKSHSWRFQNSNSQDPEQHDLI